MPAIAINPHWEIVGIFLTGALHADTSEQESPGCQITPCSSSKQPRVSKSSIQLRGAITQHPSDSAVSPQNAPPPSSIHMPSVEEPPSSRQKFSVVAQPLSQPMQELLASFIQHPWGTDEIPFSGKASHKKLKTRNEATKVDTLFSLIILCILLN